MKKLIVVAIAMSSVAIARADDDPAAAEGGNGHSTNDERTAADARGAPRPGDESGRVDDADESASALRLVGRGALALPRVALDVGLAPIRAGFWFYDRYQIAERWKQVFFNDTRTVGIYPTVGYDSNYGVHGGARFVHRDMFGKREHLSLHAATGGRYRDRYTAEVRTGGRFRPRVAAALRGVIERRPKDAFYGIGNADDALETRHRQQLRRVYATVDTRVVGGLYLNTAAAYTDLSYGPSDVGTSIEMGYDPATLTGFMTGIRHVYGELEVRWDTRRRATRWDARVLPAAGWLAAAFAGRVHQLEAGDDYWRTGVALQRFVWLGYGPRVLAARLQAETVNGSYEDVAFTELPQLGGGALLRGYPIDRFRDRVAAVGSLEYRWDLNRNLQASVFVDVGRVYPSLEDLTFDDMRLGYGVGVQAQTGSDFIAEVNVASSKDGGVFVNLALDPVFDVDRRVVRR